MKTAIYPGSFDPVTLGHLDLIDRAAAGFDRLVVAVIVNREKQGLFTIEERVEMLREEVKKYPNVEVARFDGMLVDFAAAYAPAIVVKGLRGHADWDSEYTMAVVNRKLSHGALETVFYPSAPELVCVSATAARVIASYGESLEGFVTDTVAKKLYQKYDQTART